MSWLQFLTSQSSRRYISDWSRKTCATFLTNQIQKKTNHDLVTYVFPRFRGQNGCFTCSSYWVLKLFLFFWSATEISLILPSAIQSISALMDRLDFRRYLVSGLRSTPRGGARAHIPEPIWYTVRWYTDTLSISI